jgi:lipoprotein-anchoring transpeptidase ErfK/SrfK
MTRGPHPALASKRLLALVVIVVLAAVGCSSNSGSERKAAEAPPTTIPAPKVSVTPAAGATDVPLDQALGVSVQHGTISSVSVTSPAGPVQGVLGADHTGWLAQAPLAPTTTYEISADVVDGAGRHHTETSSFTTAKPTAELHTTLNVDDNGVYGVGMPIIVRLNHPVAAAQHKALEQRMAVTTIPGITGAWRWFSDTEVHWRPATFWPAGTKVSLAINFAGFDAGNGVWGVDGRTVPFSIGDAHVSTVDAKAHTMTITNNGAVVKQIPVSTGRDKYPTHSGIHVVNERAQKVIMDSATVGIPRNSPDGYYETVFWNVRISNSGEFVHAAPWSVGDQGNTNVSHGCVNASTANAEWFYNFSRVGDVVIVQNTPLQLQPWNGYGDFQIPWNQWAN